MTAVEGQAPIAVIVYGLSPRLYWTETYALFLNMVARQFATGLSTVISHEEEAQRLEELAALDRAKTTFFSNISRQSLVASCAACGPRRLMWRHRRIADAVDARHRADHRHPGQPHRAYGTCPSRADASRQGLSGFIPLESHALSACMHYRSETPNA